MGYIGRQASDHPTPCTVLSFGSSTHYDKSQSRMAIDASHLLKCSLQTRELPSHAHKTQIRIHEHCTCFCATPLWMKMLHLTGSDNCSFTSRCFLSVDIKISLPAKFFRLRRSLCMCACNKTEQTISISPNGRDSK